jgi:hypothetical protein
VRWDSAGGTAANKQNKRGGGGQATTHGARGILFS